MITLYSFGTPHGHRASIMLEELGLPYRVHVGDFTGSEVEDPELRRVSPMGKFPAMVDEGETPPRRVFGSGAILTYLAAKSGRLMPADAAARAEAESWLMLSLTDLGPAAVGHFRFTVLAPEKLDYPVQHYKRELERSFAAIEARLAEAEYLAGPDYSIADIATFPFVDYVFQSDGLGTTHPNIARWHAAVSARPAVQRGMTVPPPAM